MAGVGWILDHSYLGAIPKRAAISGFRVRSGNIQVGSIDLLSHLFPEARFNSWSVAELHVIHPKIVPNGRRDDFEPNAHYQQLLGGVAPLAKQIGKICRDQSIIRNRLRKAHALVEAAGEALSILDATDQHDVLFETVASRVQRCCETLKQIASSTTTTPRDRSLILAQVTTLEHNLERVARSSRRKSFLKKLNPTKRIAYEHVLRLIYEHTSDLRAAHHLAQRILASIRKDVSPRRK
jgi:molecular chaperone HtpG